MDDTKRRELIDKYKAGYDLVADALLGITEEELDARPAPGKWTAREIVHHLSDSEMTSAIRLRLLLVEDRPIIQGSDQESFSKRLFYDRPHAAALEAFQAARLVTGELLDRMTPFDWAREGTHTESGPYSATKWLEIYADHAHNHAEQIRRARAAAKK